MIIEVFYCVFQYFLYKHENIFILLLWETAQIGLQNYWFEFIDKHIDHDLKRLLKEFFINETYYIINDYVNDKDFNW